MAPRSRRHPPQPRLVRRRAHRGRRAAGCSASPRRPQPGRVVPPHRRAGAGRPRAHRALRGRPPRGQRLRAERVCGGHRASTTPCSSSAATRSSSPTTATARSRWAPQRLARRFGSIRARPSNCRCSPPTTRSCSAFADAADPGTRLIVSTRSPRPPPALLPTRRIADLAAERGIRTLVDGAHAPGLVRRRRGRRRRRLVVRQPAQVALRPARFGPARHDRARPRRALAAHRLLGARTSRSPSASTPRARSTPRPTSPRPTSIEFIEDRVRLGERRDWR